MMKLFTEEAKIHHRRTICIKECDMYDAVESENRPLTIRLLLKFDDRGEPSRRRRNPLQVVFSTDEIRSLDELKVEIEECDGVFLGSDAHADFSASTASKMSKFLFGRKFSHVDVPPVVLARFPRNQHRRLRKLSAVDVSEWDKKDSLLWLEVVLDILELTGTDDGSCQRIFRENDIDGSILVELDDLSILLNIGIREEIASQLQKQLERLRKQRRVNFGWYCVLKKLHRYPGFSTDQEEFVEIARRLSDPAFLKHAYLNTADVAAMGRGRPLNGIVRVVDYQEPVEQFREARIKMKLVFSEFAYSGRAERLRKSISPVVAAVVPRFDTSIPPLTRIRPAVIVGPWYLEWTDFELVLPKRMITGRAILQADVDTLAIPKEGLKVIQDRIADLVVKWNTSYSFRESEVENEGEEEEGEDEDEERTSGVSNMEKNGLMFVEEMMETLGVSNSTEGALGNFLRELRMHGCCPLVFRPCREFIDFFALDESEMTFDTHSDFDAFCQRIREQCLDVYMCFSSEWGLLKSFDRIFWLRHLKNPEDPQFAPLPPDEHRHGAVFATGCPFDDPRQTRGYF